MRKIIYYAIIASAFSACAPPDQTPVDSHPDAGSRLDAGPAAPRCGDGTCDGTETVASCPQDCSVCGDGVCSGTETGASCPSDCDGTLVMKDASGYEIDALYAYECGAAMSTVNQLSQAVGNGDMLTLNSIPPGCWTMYAYNDSNAKYWQDDISFTAGETFTWTLDP